jgi:hypothetical protein
MSTELARSPYSVPALRAVLADAAALGVQYCTEAVFCCQQVTVTCLYTAKVLLVVYDDVCRSVHSMFDCMCTDRSKKRTRYQWMLVVTVAADTVLMADTFQTR